MRGVFGLLGLVITLAVVGLLAKRALAPATPRTGGGDAVIAPVPHNLKEQQEQIKRAAEAAMQAPRPMPDDR